MSSRIRSAAAYDVVSATGAWVREYRSDLEECSEVQDLHAQLEQDGAFWKTLDPLHRTLIEDVPGCAWCVAAIRINRQGVVRDPFRFYASGRQEVEASGTWALSGLMSLLSERRLEAPYETILATDLCLNILHDSTPLVINRGPTLLPAGGTRLF